MPTITSSGFPLASDALALVRSMLDDVDIPDSQTTSTITPTGATRASNISTITTLSAHNFQLGDLVDVRGVTDSTFSGTFTITSVPTSTSFTYANTGSNGTSGNGFAQKSNQGDVYPDSVLLPFLNAAYRKVQRRLNMMVSPTVSIQVDVGSLTAGTTSLSDTSTPQLPSDFIAPEKLWERQTGVDTFYREMLQVGQLSERSQGTYLVEWTWLSDALKFIGATVAIDLRIKYLSAADYLSSGASVIAIRDGLDPIALWTAHLASLSRSSTGTTVFAGEFEDVIHEVKQTQAQSRQFRSFRRQPYGGRRFGLGRRY